MWVFAWVTHRLAHQQHFTSSRQPSISVSGVPEPLISPHVLPYTLLSPAQVATLAPAILSTCVGPRSINYCCRSEVKRCVFHFTVSHTEHTFWENTWHAANVKEPFKIYCRQHSPPWFPKGRRAPLSPQEESTQKCSAHPRVPPQRWKQNVFI